MRATARSPEDSWLVTSKMQLLGGREAPEGGLWGSWLRCLDVQGSNPPLQGVVGGPQLLGGEEHEVGAVREQREVLLLVHLGAVLLQHDVGPLLRPHTVQLPPWEGTVHTWEMPPGNEGATLQCILLQVLAIRHYHARFIIFCGIRRLNFDFLIFVCFVERL